MKLVIKTAWAISMGIFLSATAMASGGATPDWTKLYGPEQRKEEPVLYRTCVTNGLTPVYSGPAKQVAMVCIHATKSLDQSIYDFQILQVSYTDSTTVEYGLLPMTVDAKTSHELDRNVLRGRIVALGDSRTGISTVMEGTLYLVWDRRGSVTPMFVGRTPANEPFMGSKPAR